MDNPQLEHRDAPRSGIAQLFGKVVALVAGAGVLALVFMFSIFFFAIAVTVGLLVAGRLWWKTRELRARMRESGGFAPQGPAPGRVIEGEVIRDTSDPPQ